MLWSRNEDITSVIGDVDARWYVERRCRCEEVVPS